MSKVDWSKAPEGATHYKPSNKRFYIVDKNHTVLVLGKMRKWTISEHSFDDVSSGDFISRPTESSAEIRIDAIAQNGATGEHYQFVGINEMAEAQDFLSEGLKILGDRGRQYGSNERECSFPQVAQAFNAITGNNLKGSDVCLILLLVKQVRQYAQPDRFHEDSAVDGVNYTALQAQELKKERK